MPRERAREQGMGKMLQAREERQQDARKHPHPHGGARTSAWGPDS